jgi:hypothetical protein
MGDELVSEKRTEECRSDLGVRTGGSFLDVAHVSEERTINGAEASKTEAAVSSGEFEDTAASRSLGTSTEATSDELCAVSSSLFRYFLVSVRAVAKSGSKSTAATATANDAAATAATAAWLHASCARWENSFFRLSVRALSLANLPRTMAWMAEAAASIISFSSNASSFRLMFLSPPIMSRSATSATSKSSDAMGSFSWQSNSKSVQKSTVLPVAGSVARTDIALVPGVCRTVTESSVLPILTKPVEWASPEGMVESMRRTISPFCISLWLCADWQLHFFQADYGYIHSLNL